jgi:hypothetical protein
MASTGGSLSGGETFYYAISAVDENGAESPLSFTIRAKIPAGTNTNRVILTGLSFSASTANCRVYRGPNPAQLLRIATEIAPETTFEDTGIAAALVGPPDENYDHANFYWRLELQPEIAATIHSLTTAGNSTLGMLPNELRGATVRITKGKGARQERTVIANTATTITVTPAFSVEPDATSFFVVAESTWHFGGIGATSPVSMFVPNREGATVHVSGRAANALDKESPYELAPLTRWQIGGAQGGSLDADVPPEPVFGLNLVGQGTVELLGIGFQTLTNTRTISAGTLVLHYWDELTSPSTKSLAADISSTDELVDLNAAGSAAVNDLIQLDREVMIVEEVLNGGTRYRVTRGAYGSTPAAQVSGEKIYHLKRHVTIVAFARDFFGSPASGSFAYPVFLPDARIAAAAFVVTNTRGNSPTAHAAFTQTVNKGLRTLSGGQFSIQVEGLLAVQDDAAPPLVIENPRSVRDIFAVVRQAPVGDDLALQLRQGSTVYATITIPDGENSSASISGFGLPPLSAGSQLNLDILSVPAGVDTLPGGDLTVTLRL